MQIKQIVKRDRHPGDESRCNRWEEDFSRRTFILWRISLPAMAPLPRSRLYSGMGQLTNESETGGKSGREKKHRGTEDDRCEVL